MNIRAIMWTEMVKRGSSIGETVLHVGSEESLSVVRELMDAGNITNSLMAVGLAECERLRAENERLRGIVRDSHRDLCVIGHDDPCDCIDCREPEAK